MKMKDSAQNFAKRFRHEADQLDTMNVDLDWWRDAEDDYELKVQLIVIKQNLDRYIDSLNQMAVMLERGE